MVQREVADRLLATPGGKDYGPLGVLVQALCEVEKIDTLAPGCFWPPPKVESAVVRLRVRTTPRTMQPMRLSQMLHTLFSKRRKQIGSILGRQTVLPAGIDANQRPEQLSVEQLIALADMA
jgi:16S rRNA (adenine1518-N6/adenine1519-N6)-dimethyltransferase